MCGHKIALEVGSRHARCLVSQYGVCVFHDHVGCALRKPRQLPSQAPENGKPAALVRQNTMVNESFQKPRKMSGRPCPRRRVYALRGQRRRRGDPSLSHSYNPDTQTMGKRAGMLRLARGQHEPKKAKSSAVKKHKLQLKLKKPKQLVPAVAVASAASAANNLFAMAPPTTSDAAAGSSTSEPEPQPPAFEDDSKEALMRQVLAGCTSSSGTGMIGADEHRSHYYALKQKKAAKIKGTPRYLRR